MFKFPKLVQNENMKLFRRISTLIMFLMIAGALILIGGINKHYASDQKQENWKTEVRQQNKAIKQDMQQTPPDEKDKVQNMLLENNYRLDHDVAPVTGDSVLGFADNAQEIQMFVAVFAIILAGGIVSNEFSNGTIKLLLIRPIRRTTILLSKYVSAVFAAIVLSLFSFILSILVGGIFFGFDGFSAVHLSTADGQVHETGMLLYLLGQYALNFIPVLIFLTMAFMISTVFRNTALAIGLSIFAFLAGGLSVQLFAKYEWTKYNLFANLDLNNYIAGKPPLFDSMSLGFSITVLAVYYLIFVVLAWLAFWRRDVAA